MRNLVVVRDLFVLAIISIILNSMFILNFVGGYITVAIFYGISVDVYFTRFATALESIGVFATVVCTVLTLVGSCLVVSPNKKTRTAGLVLSLVSICMLWMHFLINIIVMILTINSYIRISRNSAYLLVNACVLGPIVLFQSILLIYNSIFICVVGRSLMKENGQQGEVEIPEVLGRAPRVTVISNEPQMEPVPPYAHD